MATSVTKKGLVAVSDKVILAARPALELIKHITTDFSTEKAEKYNTINVKVLSATSAEWARGTQNYVTATNKIDWADVVLDKHKKSTYGLSDLDCLEDIGLPIYAVCSIPGGPTKVGPGEVNVPVTCGGLNVNPGDIILGDADGVIVIPREEAPALLEKAVAFCEQDSARTKAAKDGTCDRTWVRKSLLERNCEIIEDCWKP